MPVQHNRAALSWHQLWSAGAIFSPLQDFIIFWLPLLLAYLSALLFFNQSESSPLYLSHFILGIAMFDSGHVAATIGPVRKRILSKKILSKKFLLPLVIVTTMALSIHLYSEKIFFYILAPFALTHVARQHYAWLLLSRYRFQEGKEGLLWDQWLFWSFILMPITWWLSSNSSASKSYFREGDLWIYFPSWLFSIALLSTALLTVVYIYRQIKFYRPNISKYFFLASTLLWFMTLIIFKSEKVFFFALVYIHGLSYIVHTKRDLSIDKKKSKSSFFDWLTNTNTLFYILLIGLVGIAWKLTVDYTHSSTDRYSLSNFLRFLVFYPLFLHYFFDLFIWKGLKKEVRLIFE